MGENRFFNRWMKHQRRRGSLHYHIMAPEGDWSPWDSHDDLVYATAQDRQDFDDLIGLSLRLMWQTPLADDDAIWTQ